MSNKDTSPASASSPIAFFRTNSFWEKIVLLATTALLSGLVVPLVVKQTDEARARRASVLQAQDQLFRDVSETMLTFQTLVLDVSWFGTPDARDEESQRKAYARYNERAADLVARWRAQIARSRTLTSPVVSKKLELMLENFFKQQDSATVALWAICNVKCDWITQHTENEKGLASATLFIETLARDLGVVRF
jgi:hypothetical protein